MFDTPICQGESDMHLRRINILLFMILCVSAITLSGCTDPVESTATHTIAHPPEATDVPDFSGNITEIRIKAASCKDYQLDLSRYTNFKDKTLLQIQYGYLSDGNWHDIPSENYELKGIFDNEGTTGIGAAQKSHLVQIGSYLLVCHVLYTNAPNSECIISDTLGTPVQDPFANFVTAHDEAGYALLVVDSSSIIGGKELRYTAYGLFGQYYYLVIPMAGLSEDYELRITDHTWSESFNNTNEYVLTMDHIQELLELNP